jgi:MAF protein
LAVAKARLAAEQEGQGEIVLAADTVVAKADRILGKPLDQTEAHRMLMDLRAQSHQVITALMLIGDGQEAIEICETTVPMRDYGPKEVSEYVATGSPLDKAGAYGIQDSGFDPVAVEKMEGCFANVMGLPLCHLVRAMRSLGQTPEADVPLACQAHTGYDCPVYPEILRGVA